MRREKQELEISSRQGCSEGTWFALASGFCWMTIDIFRVVWASIWISGFEVGFFMGEWVCAWWSRIRGYKTSTCIHFAKLARILPGYSYSAAFCKYSFCKYSWWASNRIHVLPSFIIVIVAGIIITIIMMIIFSWFITHASSSMIDHLWFITHDSSWPFITIHNHHHSACTISIITVIIMHFASFVF